MFINGTFLDGKTSKRHSARLEVNHQQVIIGIHLSGTKLSIPVIANSYVVHPRLGSTPQELTFSDNQLFLSEDFESIKRLNTGIVERPFTDSNWLYNLENNSRLILFSVLLTIVFMYSVVVYGIPSSAKFLAHNLPAITSTQLLSTLDILDETVFEESQLSDDRKLEILTLLTPYLQGHLELSPKLVFRSGMKANALALPNGVIVFTDDFVNLTKSDDELIAVLFHELGHLTHKHMTQRLIQDAIITLVVLFMVNDLESADLVTGIPTLLLDLSYSRDFEVEADEYALAMLDKHNLPLNSFADAMTNLENYYKQSNDDDSGNALNQFFSTHPSTEDRVKMVEQYKQTQH
jgi:Zn-dependent protease with chaperone function